jgi:hypothetical protein
MALLPPAARVRIEHDHGKFGARILIDDVDVSTSVTAVTWALKAGGMAEATVTFLDVEIAADAKIVTEAAPAAEVHAVDLTVLDVKHGDKILLRRETHLTDFEFDDLTGMLRGIFPNNQVLILEGGYELSVLRETDTDTTRAAQAQAAAVLNTPEIELPSMPSIGDLPDASPKSDS